MGLTEQDLARLGPAARQQIGQAKPPKYRNRKAVRGSIRFDSQKEARRYDELILALQAGAIRDLRLQPHYTLQEAYKTPDGKTVRAIQYVADFAYQRRRGDTWVTVVEDVKSRATKTRVYELKRKLLLDRYGIEIVEV